MSIRKELIQKLIAIAIIFIMTFADIAIIGINAISYAIDMKLTNSDNVEFGAYFLDKEKHQLTEIDSIINSNNLKVYIEIAVKNEGYFNGQISLENTSFKFKSDTIENEFVKEIDDKTIKLNQINAGNTAKLELGIEFLNDENIQLQSLSKDNSINLAGIYKTSKKDIEIKGSANVKVNWKSPEELITKLGAKILTNKIYKIEENNKRILQVLIDSKLENDLYPLKQTEIKLNVPNGAEEVKVHSRSTNATNGDIEFSEKNYRYDVENGLLDINIQNAEKDGQISWRKNEKDSLVVTFIYAEDSNLKKQEIKINNKITTYDEKQVTSNCSVLIEEEIKGLITTSINSDEKEIYKGKLYTGENRYYTTSTIINVNYALMDKIQIEEKQALYCIENEEKNANIQYVQSKIKKEEFDKIFGEDGHLTILDQEENIIANINKDTEKDENGFINIDYSTGVKAIIIRTSKPQSEKTLNIYHKKVILDNDYSREEIKKFTAIKEEVINEYNQNSINIVELKNTESKASLKINKDTLSVINENKNIEIVATLETNDEAKDLYKNSTVDIIFPQEFKDVTIASAKALYRNGLKIANCEKIKNEDGNIVLHIEFEGEQKKYNSEILNGLEIHIYADILINKITPQKSTKIIMNYTNDNGDKDLYTVEKEINIKSQEGIVIYNSLSNYNNKQDNLEIIAKEKSTAKLDMNSKSKIATVKTAIINNYDKEINDKIVIIGNIPVENKENTFSTEIKNLRVSEKDAIVYYNTDINAKTNDKSWTKQSDDAKSYKIVLNSMEASEVVGISYDMSIPEKLSYNEKGILTTNVTYSYEEEKISDSSDIILKTEQAILKTESVGDTTVTESGLEVNIVAISGNKELTNKDSIYEGETIRYSLDIENKTGNDCNNLTIKATQTNGNIFDLVEEKVFNPIIYDGDGTGFENYWRITDSNTKEFKNINIKNGEKISLEYQVVINKNETDETYADIDIISEDSSIKDKITTDKYKIKDAELKLLYIPPLSEETIWQTDTVQQTNLQITNISEQDLTDIEIQITLSKEVNFDENKDYLECSPEIEIHDIKKEVNSLGQTIVTLKVKKLAKGTTGEIYVKSYILDFDGEKANAEFFAKATSNTGATYTSNNIIRKIKQVGKIIQVNQIAKINEKEITENTIINDGDKLDFHINIKNADTEDADLNFYNYIQTGLEVKAITLINVDKSKTDITEKYNQQSLQYQFGLKAGEEIGIIISTVVNTSNLNEKDSIINRINIDDLKTAKIYTSSIEIKVNVKPIDDGEFNITVNQKGNLENGTIVKNGDQVKYIINISNIGAFERTIDIYDYINSTIKNITVLINNEDVTNKYLQNNDLVISQYKINGNTSLKIEIQGTLDLTDYKHDSISNEVIIKSTMGDMKSNNITYYITQDEPSSPDVEPEIKNYTVSGQVWLDSNKNGKRDDNEEVVKDMEVKVIDTSTQKLLSTVSKTKEDGTYQLTLPQGKYIVVFMYDNEKYYITTYQAEDVNKEVNSDVISKKLNIDDKEITVGATDVLNLSSNKKNIDMGLVFINKFDLKLEKYVSKIVTVNKNGTKTNTFDKADLAKIEIASKYLSGSTVLIEYKIRVSNVGDIDGVANKIVDYIPSGMSFNSDINNDWYKSGKYLYNESVKDKVISPGKSYELTLTLTKIMTDSNVGLSNNTAKIEKYTNEKNYIDDNIENNKDMADVIIAVKTGESIRFALIIISLIIIIAIVIYYIIKRFNINKI